MVPTFFQWGLENVSKGFNSKTIMNTQSLALLLQQTLDTAKRAEAETELDKVSKIIGFAPGILQVLDWRYFFW